MKSRFLTALHFLKIVGDLGRGDKLDETTFITNNKEQIYSILPKTLIPLIGKMEADSIINSSVVVYSDEKISKNIKPEDFLIKKLYSLMTFLNAVWMFRDNSINKELSFLFYGDSKFEYAHSNFVAVRYSHSTGIEEEITIGRNELKKMRTFFRERMSIAEYKPQKLTRLEKGTQRISRAFYHVSGARNSRDLGIKIASYCSALEALFATSQAELAHQLAERVACFLADDPAQRLDLYRTVKKVYAVRSKIVHGAAVKLSKVEELPDISEEIDRIVRATFVKILNDRKHLQIFDSSPERLDEFMLNRIFRA